MDAPPPDTAVTVLDGGLATELERRGHDLSDDLWSARLLLEAPEEVVAAHLAFFAAGAQVATTATYQASFEGLARRGLDGDEAAAVMRRGVALAVAARERHAADTGREDPLLVAASVGPYGAVLADGSEYSGDYGLTDRALRDFHRRRMGVLATAGADLLAIETVPSLQEGQALVSVLDDLPDGTTAWLSFTCADERRTRRGDPVEQAFALARESSRVVAVGVNCTAPQHAAALVAAAAEAGGKPVVVYPNSGETWDGRTRSWRGSAAEGLDAAAVARWVEAGARWVGGCCRVGPAQIAAIAAAVSGLRPGRLS